MNKHKLISLINTAFEKMEIGIEKEVFIYHNGHVMPIKGIVILSIDHVIVPELHGTKLADGNNRIICIDCSN